MSEQLTVGVIGLGIMGGAFAQNILAEDFPVIGHDVVKENLDKLVENGGIAGKSARAVAEKSDVIITSLPSAASFHSVISGPDGISSAKNSNLIVIECSTLAIEDKQTAHDALQNAGVTLLDCPISGTGSQAKQRISLSTSVVMRPPA